jgi:hypothetical protein
MKRFPMRLIDFKKGNNLWKSFFDQPYLRMVVIYAWIELECWQQAQFLCLFKLFQNFSILLILVKQETRNNFVMAPWFFSTFWKYYLDPYLCSQPLPNPPKKLASSHKTSCLTTKPHPSRPQASQGHSDFELFYRKSKRGQGSSVRSGWISCVLSVELG